MIDMGDVLSCFAQTVVKKVVTVRTVDFEVQSNTVATNIQAVVQPADPEKLTSASIDWSLKHYRVDTTDPLQVGQFIEYKGADYKVIIVSDFDDYGYTMAIVEEVKK